MTAKTKKELLDLFLFFFLIYMNLRVAGLKQSSNAPIFFLFKESLQF